MKSITNITYSYSVNNLLHYITVNIIGKYNPSIIEEISKYNIYLEDKENAPLFTEGKQYYLVTRGIEPTLKQMVFAQNEEVFKEFVKSFVFEKVDDTEPLYRPNGKNNNYLLYKDIAYSNKAIEILKLIIENELYFISNIIKSKDIDDLNLFIRENYFNSNDDKDLIEDLNKVIICINDLFSELNEYSLFRYKIENGVIILEYIDDARLLEWKMLKEKINEKSTKNKNDKKHNKEYLSLTEYYLNNNPLSLFI